MQTITLSNEMVNDLRQVAALRGMEPDAYAEELLAISIAVLRGGTTTFVNKPHHVMEFSGIAPTGRTAAEIDAEIEAGRAEWDDTDGENASSSASGKSA